MPRLLFGHVIVQLFTIITAQSLAGLGLADEIANLSVAPAYSTQAHRRIAFANRLEEPSQNLRGRFRLATSFLLRLTSRSRGMSLRTSHRQNGPNKRSDSSLPPSSPQIFSSILWAVVWL
ncbi:hypothetical protein EV421DRAFT_1802500 [Armillaria borealis]|uniref:Secreted protein n=1 Tax=Armillaria borealis TaxID=47425 RepID=A0AA39JKZ3_9AGAR|nr:hypothetical protein EV421DRAFT_1802500 [Armillaria borealis]